MLSGWEKRQIMDLMMKATHNSKKQYISETVVEIDYRCKFGHRWQRAYRAIRNA